MKFFPTLNAIFHDVDYNALAREFKLKNPGIDWKNPFVFQSCIDSHLAQFRLDGRQHFSYGGWLENRKDLWEGTYMEHSKLFCHLGVDITVPVGTPVAIPFSARLIEVYQDLSSDVGWGTRLLFEPTNGETHIIFGHLDAKLCCREGDILNLGDLIGIIGRPPENGNVFPHLHVQAITSEHMRSYDNWHDIDGYGPEYSVMLPIHFPEPLSVIEEFSRL